MSLSISLMDLLGLRKKKFRYDIIILVHIEVLVRVKTNYLTHQHMEVTYTSAWPVTLSRKSMFNPSSGVWFWDGTIALTGKLSHLRILIIVYDFLLDWITSHEFSFSHDFLWFIVGLNHILWVGFFSWFPMIYCWIESHPVDWVFPLISCDLLLDWITSCELAFSLDFPWFTVELNHIPWIGFFSWFPVIYCQIESHPVNWVFPAMSCLIELHPVHLVVPMISCWIKSQFMN